jgi:uncharacterized membrane protein
MTFTEWLLFFHVLAAFLTVAAVVLYLTILVGGGASLRRLSGPATLLWNVGGIGVLVLGIWLAIDIDGYKVWDGWIIAAILLWVIASAAGGPLGRDYREAEKGDGRLPERARLLSAVMAIATLALLVDMIYKPGV